MKEKLNSFQIKVIALILMTFDHIHYMFSSVTGCPIWFNMLGRIAAPLFIFMVANGMRYTKSREKYLIRLFVGSVVMTFLNKFIGANFEHPAGAQLFGNIFSTLFLICLYIYLGGKIKDAFKEKKYSKVVLCLIGMMIPVLISVIVLMLMSIGNVPIVLLNVFMFIPSLIVTEGGFMFVILGIGFYLCGTSKIKQRLFYTVYCIILFITSMSNGISVNELFSVNIQWIMIFALPIILSYNNKKGRSMKYLFYLYYPIHIYALYFLSIFAAKWIQ